MLAPELSAELRDFLHRELGDHEYVSERGATGGDRVVEVAGPNGRHWFLKQVVDPQSWRREVRAYRQWTEGLGDRAPQLRAAAEDLGVLLTSAVPGRRADTLRQGRPEIHRRAGALARILHEAVPAEPMRRNIADRARSRLEAELRRADGLLSRDEIAVARELVVPLDGLDLGERGGTVPCHGDLTPRNLLVDDTGVVRIIDFGSSVRHVPAFDLVRLCYGVWWERPGLADHFFAGYGRRPTDAETVLVRAYVAIHAVSMARMGRTLSAAWVERRAHDRLGTRLAEVLRAPT